MRTTTDIENAGGVSVNDPDGENRVPAFMLRAQIDWEGFNLPRLGLN